MAQPVLFEASGASRPPNEDGKDECGAEALSRVGAERWGVWGEDSSLHRSRLQDRRTRHSRNN